MKWALVQCNALAGDFNQNKENILNICKNLKKEGVHGALFPAFSLSGYPIFDLSCNADFWIIYQKTFENLIHNLDKDFQIALTEYNFENKETKEKAFFSHYFIKKNQIFLKIDKNKKGEFLKFSFSKNAKEKDKEPTLFENNDFFDVLPEAFEKGISQKRFLKAEKIIQENKGNYFFTNLLASSGHFGYDGGAFILSQNQKYYPAPFFEPGALIYENTLKKVQFFSFKDQKSKNIEPIIAGKKYFDDIYWELIYKALIYFLRDFVHKSGFQKVHLGLSGGIDSALVAVLAVKAFGAENVVVFKLPSQYSSVSSLRDANHLIKILGIKDFELSIKNAFSTINTELETLFENDDFGLTQENLQARLRGIYLMSYSNKMSSFVLNTGNKSELATGYCTLYGDMVGGMAVIGDLYKTEVYKLAHYIDKLYSPSPFTKSLLTKAPSAELRPDQKDEDSLPAYAILDKILYALIEEKKSYSEIVQLFPSVEKKLIQKINYLLYRNEYKRFQAPCVLRLSKRAFGNERKMPFIYHNFETSLAKAQT